MRAAKRCRATTLSRPADCQSARRADAETVKPCHYERRFHHSQPVLVKRTACFDSQASAKRTRERAEAAIQLEGSGSRETATIRPSSGLPQPGQPPTPRRGGRPHDDDVSGSRRGKIVRLLSGSGRTRRHLQAQGGGRRARCRHAHPCAARRSVSLEVWSIGWGVAAVRSRCTWPRLRLRRSRSAGGVAEAVFLAGLAERFSLRRCRRQWIGTPGAVSLSLLTRPRGGGEEPARPTR